MLVSFERSGRFVNLGFGFCDAHYEAYSSFKVLHFYRIFLEKCFENIKNCKFYDFLSKKRRFLCSLFF